MSMGLALAAVILGAMIFLLLVRSIRGTTRAFVSAQRLTAERDLASLFIFASGFHLALLTAACAAVLTVLAWAITGLWPVAVPAFIMALYVPRMLIRHLQRRRLGRIAEQLPDALAFWAGLLQAGQGLHPSLNQLAERQPRPLGEELRVVTRQCRLGVSADIAVEQMCLRLGVADLRMLASLLHVSRELGGNLGESLLRLSDLLRTRLAMEARIRSLTSQGRLQGTIVGALPLLLMLVLSFMDPGAMRMLFTHPLGWVALGMIAILEITGFLLIRRIVAIEV
ncbi:MAG: type II secretion system F family protein [Steroidobacteraceae bacterium]